MVGLQAMVLGRLGRTENSPSKSVCSILPIAICGPGSYGAPAFILSFAALFGFPPSARPSLCAPSALHGTSDGATMFAPGGAGTTPRTVFDNSFVLGATGFYHRVGATTSQASTLRFASSLPGSGLSVTMPGGGTRPGRR
jgi:hypothetical protein